MYWVVVVVVVVVVVGFWFLVVVCCWLLLLVFGCWLLVVVCWLWLLLLLFFMLPVGKFGSAFSMNADLPETAVGREREAMVLYHPLQEASTLVSTCDKEMMMVMMMMMVMVMLMVLVMVLVMVMVLVLMVMVMVLMVMVMVVMMVVVMMMVILMLRLRMVMMMMMMPFGSFQGWPAMWCSYRFRFLEIPPGSVGWFNSTDPSKLWILPNSSLRSHPWWRSTWHEICDSRIEPMPRKDGSPYSWPWTKRAAQEFTGFPYWIQAPRFTNRSKIFKDLIRNGGYWMIFGRLSTTLSRHIENQMHVDRTCILRWYPIIYSKICVVQFISKSSTCAELMGQIYRHSIWSRVYVWPRFASCGFLL